jgi:protease I
MADLKKLRIAVLATDGFEEAELTEPVRALKEGGANPAIVSPHPRRIQAFKHHDKTIAVAGNRGVTGGELRAAR